MARMAQQELAVDLTPTRRHNFETRLIRFSWQKMVTKANILYLFVPVDLILRREMN